MADAPDTATFVTTSDQQDILPNSKELYADPVVDQFQFDVESTRIHLKPTSTMLSMTEMDSTGFMKFSSVTKAVTPKVFLESDTIEFNEDASTISFLVKDSSSIQNIGFYLNGVAKSTKPAINFKAGANVAITINEDTAYNDVTISATSSVSQISGTGIVTTNGTTLTGRLITSTDNTVDITNPGGIAGNIDLSVPGVSGSEATFFVQDDTDLPPNAIDLSQPGARMGIGLASPTCSIDILSADSDNVLNGVTDTAGGGVGGITLTNYGNSIAECSLLLQGSRGSIGDDPEDQQIQSGDVISSLRTRGMDDEGGFSDDVGAIKFTAAQNFTGTLHGTNIEFYTTTNTASATLTRRMELSYRGFLGINKSATPEYPLDVTATTIFTTNDYTAANFVSTTASAGSDFGGIRTQTTGGPTKVRLARINAASGAVQGGQIIGEISYEGYNAANYFVGTRIASLASQTWSGSNRGTSLSFYTTPNNTSTPIEAIRVEQTGYLSVLAGLTATAGPASFGSVSATDVTIVSTGTTPLDTTSNTTSASAGGPIVTNYGGAGGANAALLLRGSRGTSGTPLAVQSGDIISAIRSQGMNDAASFGSGANGAIRFVAAENFVSTTNKGTDIVIFTTPTGAGTAGQSMIIKGGSSTKVGIATTAPICALELYGTDTITNFGTLALQTIADADGANQQGGIRAVAFGGTVPTSNVFLLGSRATKAAPRRIQSNDLFAAIRGRGYFAANDSTDATIPSADTATIGYRALESFTTTAQGTQVEISTTPTGSTTQAVSVYVRGGGTTDAKVGIGMVPTTMLELLENSAQKPGAGGLWSVTPCDGRVKTEVEDLPEALAKIRAMKPRQYKFTPEYVAYRDECLNAHIKEGEERIPNDACVNKMEYGFLAEELVDVFPESVSVTDRKVGDIENLKSVNLGLPLVMLFKAFQELADKVDALEAQLAG